MASPRSVSGPVLRVGGDETPDAGDQQPLAIAVAIVTLTRTKGFVPKEARHSNSTLSVASAERR